KRIWVQVNWEKVPEEKFKIPIQIIGAGDSITVYAKIKNKPVANEKKMSGFIESNGYVSMEAVHYTKAVSTKNVEWKIIPGLGRTLSGVTAFPVTLSAQSPKKSYLEYRMYLYDTGSAKVKVYLSPTLNIHHTKGLSFGLSLDDGVIQKININENKSDSAWQTAVSNNIKIKSASFQIQHPGWHTLRIYLINPGVVFQKIEVDLNNTKDSYL